MFKCCSISSDRSLVRGSSSISYVAVAVAVSKAWTLVVPVQSVRVCWTDASQGGWVVVGSESEKNRLTKAQSIPTVTLRTNIKTSVVGREKKKAWVHITERMENHSLHSI